MPQRCEDVFGCIESAQDFLALLLETISETKGEVEADLQKIQNGNGSAKAEALRIASYDLQLLQLHLCRSKRLLNDLRMVRRVLLKLGGVPEQELPAMPAPIPSIRIDIPLRPVHVPRQDRGAQRHAKRQDMVTVAAA